MIDEKGVLLHDLARYRRLLMMAGDESVASLLEEMIEETLRRLRQVGETGAAGARGSPGADA